MLVYQFYSELDDYKPKIRRRFQTSGSISLARLGYIVMTLYEMKGHHMFDVEYEKLILTPDGHYIGRESLGRYSVPRLMDGSHDSCLDATKEKISSLNLEPPHQLTVEYDFGDSWTVTIKLEKIIDIPELTAKDLPRVLKGSGWGIVEDCGGVPGLEELTQAFQEKQGETYENLREWLGVDEFDMSKFDLDDMNLRLKKIPAILANIYEKGKAPTQKQIELLERDPAAIPQ